VQSPNQAIGDRHSLSDQILAPIYEQARFPSDGVVKCCWKIRLPEYGPGHRGERRDGVTIR
jgi:hypothetical protein